MPTGIPGLDELISGGFPSNTVNLILGPAGSGKTLFGLEFLYNGAHDYNDPGLLVVLEESRENVLRATAEFDMDFDRYEKKGLLHLVDFGEIRASAETEEEIESEIASLRTLQRFLDHYITSSGVRRITIDSLSAVGLYYSESDVFRREVFSFFRFLKEKRVTPLIIAEAGSGGGLNPKNVEHFLADSVLILDYDRVNGEFRRTITVYKMRFTAHDPYTHPFIISNSGIEVWAKEQVFHTP